ncbi:DNA mismatch repair protein MutT [Brevirhabdus pacifica]|uniref:DNA mismatch repair protein MutT n=1 Tax=Brevirhabdus pacifica TaxID=1267768 RepID=A0A1U7DG15_9RHOB|nr:NUDIX hydrolase [Brevirhabdus pacifica]APX88901.1 DNA mismatch repair protein MutT [Brevirhabdus pacifica]OWU80132.1 DNA mismatch repair protein MutT [Loktanella sp. 22II-4b]PJJ86552.1 8-oxo-dGTP pyrophosphatase MutT (NUDIX family) [Brevirhabdus pacifica]
MDRSAIRDAATVIMVRHRGDRPHLLLGQRGKTAAFMPSKFVFPGGAVDPEDGALDLTGDLDRACLTRLRQQSDPALAPAIVTAAIREVWEETGLKLAVRDEAGETPTPGWEAFQREGLRPSAQGFSFVFRAITPPGRPRRFDARFFLVSADQAHGDLDDFSEACDELSHLQWVPLDEVRRFDLPYITEVVVAEVAHLLKAPRVRPASVPFFNNVSDTPAFRHLT